MNALQDTSDLFSTDASVIGKSSKVRVVSHKALAIDEDAVDGWLMGLRRGCLAGGGES